MIDKLMRTIESSDAHVAAYLANPQLFVSAWEARAVESRVPLPDAGYLTDEERAAFVARSYGALYRLGAHPYLLWHFSEAVWVHEVAWPELIRRYKDAVEPHGLPDFTT